MLAKWLIVVIASLCLVDAHWVEPNFHQRKRFCNNEEITCMLIPELIEGPYYIADRLVRKDITEGKEGIFLRLVISVVDATTCNVAVNAAVDVWQCDALGLYSHYLDPTAPVIDNTTFLRGIQLTDNTGSVTFDTIYPGWYEGRVIHIHVKVHFGGEVEWGSNSTGKYVGGSNAFTGQLFFSDDISDAVAALPPYNTSPTRRLSLEEDFIYQDGGSYGMTTVSYIDPNLGLEGGLIAYISLGVDPEAVSDPDPGFPGIPTRPSGP